jgi:hypothetical protein
MKIRGERENGCRNENGLSWTARLKTCGRSTRIRTLDPLVPNQVRYRAALHSDDDIILRPRHSVNARPQTSSLAAMRLAIDSASSAWRASTITRTSGSVPDARISTRPSSPSSRSTACLLGHHGLVLGPVEARLHAHIDQGLGEQLQLAQHSARLWPLRLSADSTCRAETMPSPVVCLSSASRWPEPSPPRIQPRSCIISST